jgi:2-desacetyl-2-hydroxyethyl bacteriochlorophyllide A dehydrogenase
MMPDHSWNIVFTGKEQVEFRREPLAQPGPRQALVATSRTLVSMGTELICFQRRFEEGTHWDRWVKYPFYPGYCNVGRVVALGGEVEGLTVGERVATRGGHRQFILTDAGRAVPVPEGLGDEEATWFGLAGIVQNAVRRAEHELGDAVAVIGLGPLGQLAVQYTRVGGAREVIAIDTVPGRLEIARAHGATQTLCAPAGETLGAVGEITIGRLADVVYDVTGHPAAFPAALQLARRFGKVILLGDTGAPSEQRLIPDLITRGLKVIGAHDTNPPPVASDHLYWSHRNMAQLFFTYLARGQMRTADLITHRYSPEQAAECYAALARDRSAALGVIFDWSALGAE